MSISMNGVYINGLDTPSTLLNTLNEIPGSGSTDYILFSLNVSSSTSADINFGLTGPVLASNGSTLPAAATLLGSIVRAGVLSGSCKRVWLSIGGWESTAFSNMGTIIAGGGALATTLNANLLALYDMIGQIPGVQAVGFDLDDEEPSINAANVALITETLYRQFTCPITYCPFQGLSQSGPSTNPHYTSVWVDALALVYQTLGVQPVVGFNLQTYAGGTGNNPDNWATAVSQKPNTGVSVPSSFIWPIFSMDTTAAPVSTPAQMASSLQGWKSAGGSFWATAALTQTGQTYSWGQYADAIAGQVSGT